MCFVYGALVRAQQPSLDQGGDLVHCGEQLVGILPASSGGALAVSLVDVAKSVQPVISHPAVGDHGRSGLDVVGDEAVQAVRRTVAYGRDAAATDPPWWTDLDRDGGEDLLASGPAAAQSWLLAADIGLVHLDRASEPVAAWTHQHRADPVQYRPHGLVRTDLQRPL